jgi:hypothetical protein
MIRRPPLISPKAPAVRSSNESESNISPNALEYDGETKNQKRARERKNKLKKLADTAQGNVKKSRQDTSLTLLNMIERSQNKKQKKDTQLGRQTTLHMSGSEN